MARRPDRDFITIESVQQGGDFSFLLDRCTQYEVLNDLTAPFTARFEFGDESTWAALEDVIKIGGKYVVTINGRKRVTGRLMQRFVDATADAGTTMQLTVQSYLADALFTPVDPKIGVRNVKLFDLVTKAFFRMGYRPEDFIPLTWLERDVMTGKSNGGKIIDARQLTEDEARPQVGESVWAFVDRHLSRFGMMLWDAGNGQLLLGTPDDTQRPSYQMTMLRSGVGNNLMRARHGDDYDQIPQQLYVYGQGGSRDQGLAKVKARVEDPVLTDALAHNYALPIIDRSVVVVDDSIRTQAQAEARARREMSTRRRNANTWELETDGFAYWTGQQPIPYIVDTVADVRIDQAGITSGPYLIWRVVMTGNAQDGHKTVLSSVGKGIWVL